VFNEKTWPTSMVIAAITWNLNQPRMPKNIRFNAFCFLDGLIRLAATTGKFNITVQTELPGVLGMHILHWKYIHNLLIGSLFLMNLKFDMTSFQTFQCIEWNNECRVFFSIQ